MKIKNTFLILLIAFALLFSSCLGDNGDPSVDNGGGGNKIADCTAGDHVDADGNEICDGCGASVVIILDLYALNDLHGKLDDGDSCVGVDELSTYLSNAYKDDDAAIVLSSGDMWQGSAESNLTKGTIITEWMNEMNFVSMTLGNHEFDWGSEYIKENAALAEFSILAINVIDKESGQRADFCEPSVIVERNGVKIGIIGAIGDCKSSISASKVTDVDFKVGAELTALVKAESERLRREGCELIVYSIHDGSNRSTSGVSSVTNADLSSYYDIALSDGYVDLVFEGHSHMSYIQKDTKGVYHLQNGGYDNGISHVELKLNVVTDSVEIRTAEIVENNEYADLADHPVVDELLAKYDDVIAHAIREIGFNSEIRDANYIRRLVADLYTQRGLEKWGDAYDIVLGGGYISARDPGMFPAGVLHYYDVMSVLPFDNDICLCTVKGENMLRQFINSTNGNYFVAYSAYGLSIVDNVDPNATYYIISDRYSVDYAPNGLTVVDTLGADVFARDLVADFALAGGLGSYRLSTIPEINEIGNSLAYNAVTSSVYYVKGIVRDLPDATYGNTTIVDEDGNTLYIYGIRSGSDDLYNTIQNKLAVGDTVILAGVIQNYKASGASESLIEMKNAVIIPLSTEPDEPDIPDEPDTPDEPDVPTPPFSTEGYTLTSIPDAIRIAEGMAYNASSNHRYYVKGKVISEPNAKYGNLTLEDENGATLYVYGIYGTDGCLFEQLAEKPAMGDTVVLYGALLHYQNTNNPADVKLELKSAWIVEIIPASDAEGPDAPSVSDALTVKQALDIAATITTHDTFTADAYYVVGVVDEIKNNTFGNMYIKDAAGNKIYVYGVYDQNGTRYDGLTDKPVVGDTVLLLAVIGRYNGNPQLKNAVLIEIAEEGA